MPVRVPLQFAKPSMRLASAVCDAEGRLVAGVGTALGANVVRTLRRMAIQTVVVDDGADVAVWEQAVPVASSVHDLERRMRHEPSSEPLALLRAAVTRLLERRAARLERTDDDGAAAESASVRD
jgi:hypothetical protein